MNIIVAYSRNMGIGLKNNIPWKLRADMKFFKDKTIGTGQNCIIMGKNTWESLPKKPLPNRENLILSTTLQEANGAHIFNNTNNLVDYVNKIKYNNVWVIGGSSIYNEFLNNGLTKNLYITKIHKDFESDVFFPEIPDNYSLKWESDIKTENDIDYSFCLFTNTLYSSKLEKKLNHSMDYQ